MSNGSSQDETNTMEGKKSLASRFKEWASNFFKTSSVLRFLKHLVLVFLLVGGMYSFSVYVRNESEGYANDWRKEMTPSDNRELIFPSNTPIIQEEQKRLQDQLTCVRQRVTHHLKVMQFFYTRFYMGVITFSIAAALAAIALVLISKKGWEATNEFIITGFFVMTATSVFYGSWPGVFRQEDNIKDNKVLYLKYLALENELLSYPVTNEGVNYNVSSEDLKKQASTKPDSTSSGKSQTNTNSEKKNETEKSESKFGTSLLAKEFIHYIDLQLAQDNFAVGFDYTKLPDYKSAFTTK